MVTIVELQIPATETLFAEAVECEPSLELELEQVVMTTGIPLRIRGPSREDVERALSSTRSIERYDLISNHDKEWIYSIQCEEDFQILSWIVETGGTVLTATLSDGIWSVRLRYTDHDNVEETVNQVKRNGIEIDITAIRNISGDDQTEAGLTDEQYEALKVAVEYGYFEIPRRTTLMELSEHLDISHQSLSERLRRAQKGLLATNLPQAGTASASERAI
ncbi:helix-turn-helix domain-containing protein [Natronorarus salvus]|uniref:helix-turn-helix domain-containing protein n=1 Tax=Natronorarus salvus TaxID=3117733 RepID=UPI002F263858